MVRTIRDFLIARLRKWFAPPFFPGDEEKTRRASLLNITLLTGMFYLGIMIPTLLLQARAPVSVLVVNTIFFAVTMMLYFLLHRGRVAFVARASMISLFIWITLLSTNQGIISTPATSAYLFLVILSGMLFEWRGVLVASAAGSLTVLALILVEKGTGLISRPEYVPTYIQWISYTLLVAITGGLGFYDSQVTRKALKQAKSEIARRKLAELQLLKLTRAVEQSPASIVITDLHANIEYVNPRFTQVTGYTLAEVIGKNPRFLNTKLTPRKTHIQLWNTVAAGKEWRGEFVNRKKDGSLYYESAVISLITDPQGVPTHYLAVKEDITERKHAEDALRESEARWQFALEGAGDGVWDWNTRTNTVFFSRQWKAMLGYAEDEIGDSLDEWEKRVHRDDIDDVLSKIDRHFTGKTSTYISEHRVQCKNGSYKWILDRGKVVEWTEDGKPLRVIGTHTDITDRRWMEQQLRESEAQNRAIIDSVPDLLFRIRSDGIILAYHAPDESALYVPPAVFLNKSLEDVVPPDVAQPAMAAIEQSLATNQMVMFEYEMELNREINHFESRIVPLSAGDVLLVIRDITERRRAEEALHSKTKELDLYFTTSLDLFCIADTDGFFRRLNPEWERTLGYALTELEDRPLLDFVHPDDVDSTLATMAKLDAQETILNFVNRYRCKDGSYRWIEWRSMPFDNLVYAAARDITERKQTEDALRHANEQLQGQLAEIHQLQAELREQSLRDPLTGLHNRRYLGEMLEREMIRARRENSPLSIIVSDIDDFKTINDGHGHQVGDQFLTEVAKVLKNNARASDIVCRQGGEEFLLVIPGTSMEDACKRADEIRQKCEELVLRHDGQDLRVTMSFGVATYPIHGQEAEEIIMKADKALYQSKQAGRNQVSAWKSDGR